MIRRYQRSRILRYQTLYWNDTTSQNNKWRRSFRGQLSTNIGYIQPSRVLPLLMVLICRWSYVQTNGESFVLIRFIISRLLYVNIDLNWKQSGTLKILILSFTFIIYGGKIDFAFKSILSKTFSAHYENIRQVMLITLDIHNFQCWHILCVWFIIKELSELETLVTKL